MLTDPNIVVASDQMPSKPEGLIRAPLFAVAPPDISDLRKKFDRARDAANTSRPLAQKDRDWFDGPKQLNSEVRSTLKMRGQPAIYTNQIRPAINGILGVMQSAKVDPRAYLDDKGANICPIEAVSYAVDRENNRYGHVRDMIPIQDEINARRSRLLHLANTRQIQEREQGAARVDATTARREAARADGIIPSGWQLVPTADLAAGQQLLLTESKMELQRMAPTPATLGREGGASSGRERLVMQQAGMTELARAMGRIEEWEHRCYKQMWWRAQQFWTAPKFIRVTDDLNASKFLQINEPVVDGQGQPVPEVDPRTGQPVTQPVAGPDGQPLINPLTGQPQMQMVQAVRNRIAELDLDIIIDTVAEQKALNTKFEMSQVLAQQTHGEDAVKAATDWAMDKAKTDPTFASQYMSNPHPLDFIVRQHKRDAQLAAIGDDPDEYVRRRAVELGLTASTVAPVAAVAQQVPKPAAPPKSLVNAPSQGGVSEVPVGKLAGMETVFPR